MEEQITTGAVGRKYGLIFGLISAMIFIGSAAARLDLGFAGIPISWGVVITALVLACKNFKAENGGFMSFGQGFSVSMWVTFIGGIVRSVLQYVYVMIDPDYMDFLKEQRANQSFGPAPDPNQPVPDWVEFFNTAEFLVIASIISAIFAGLIFGAIVAAVTKNEAEEF
ncbi:MULTISPECIES: DUF4199 domain-containing protein [Roseivirga]|uniref:DUF4199 domain-containing protein n=1 Tax=Roseivirga thermotolerans TaxID=1758176 RepID=A0ABQ3I930_9BACT|nr:MULTISPECIES: DUF4199 domain-containing protein [Roseivirga]MEC7753693.1 DUF4199 domain-containing protein [Bacteroidota bacterium]GHE64695.1 hypothetical protein GCM10011340_19570 [Roseivirga thermotolerans]|tara:strand:- start:9021 stop:9524 length:504 start_codon:yes stop_codon:yes gene_type:complete